MIFKKTIKLIGYLDYLIQAGKTGSPKDLAGRIGVSERTLFNYLSDLKELGAPIFWSAEHNSYVYLIPGRIKFGFSSDNPPEQENPNYLHFNEKIYPGRQETFINN